MAAERPSAATRLADVDELDLSIDQLVAGGDGLGRFEGIPIFVARSAPGDRLRVRLVERKPGYGRGEIVKILTPGPGRRTPPCPYFSRCGGCDLQHLEDDLQTRLKVQALAETLLRVGGVKSPGEIRIHGGKSWAWRLRTQLHVGSAVPPAETEGEGGDDDTLPRYRPPGPAVGYFARRSHELVAVAECPILVPELEALLPRLPELLAAAGGPSPRRLDLAAGDGGQVTSAPVVPGLPHGEVRVRVGDFDYAFDARCFFQGHRGLLPTLVEEVVGPWQGELALDLYAGAGLFSLPLGRRYAKVIAVEGDRIAGRYARANARRHKLEGVDVVNQAVESWLAALPGSLRGAGQPDRIVLDPPRQGLSVEVRRALAVLAAPRLTYVSCHPAALARDLRALGLSYRVESLAVLDLFPQSGHLEAVVQLVRTA